MSRPPYFYQEINVANAAYSPSTLHTKNNRLFAFFYKYLLMKAFSIYKFNLPKTWDKKFFLYTLFQNGVMAVFKTDRFGVIPMWCGLGGYNVFYQPAYATISNPLINAQMLDIGRQCELILLQPDYTGLADVCSYYADQMAIASETVTGNTFNSRLAHVFMTKNSGIMKSYKKMADEIYSGEPSIFVNNRMANDGGDLTAEMFDMDLKANFIVPELQEVLAEWERLFCTEVGIPTANQQKKQRLVVDEVNANNVETCAAAEVRLEMLRDSMEKVRDMFGYTESDLSVDWRTDPMSQEPINSAVEGGGTNERNA